MTRCLLALALIASSLGLVKSDDVPSVPVGEASIRLPFPPGLVDVPANSSVESLFTAMMPPGTVTLQKSIVPDALKNSNTPGAEAATLCVTCTPLGSTSKDMDSTAFQNLVKTMETKFSAGNSLPINNDDGSSYAALKKKLAEMGASGISGAPTTCLGQLAKGQDFVTFVMRNHASIDPANGGDFKPTLQSLLTLSYVRVKQKLLIIFVVRTNDTLSDKDLDSLKGTTGQYISGILAANKAPTP